MSSVHPTTGPESPAPHRTGAPRMVKLLLAGNAHQAEQYARKMEWPQGEWKYITGLPALLEIKDAELHKTGTWETRDDAPEILRALRLIQQHGGNITPAASDHTPGETP